MLLKKKIKLMRQLVKSFSDMTQGVFKKDHYCLHIDYVDGNSKNFCFKRLKTALSQLQAMMGQEKYLNDVEEIYFVLYSESHDMYEIAAYEQGNLRVL